MYICILKAFFDVFFSAFQHFACMHLIFKNNFTMNVKGCWGKGPAMAKWLTYDTCSYLHTVLYGLLILGTPLKFWFH